TFNWLLSLGFKGGTAVTLGALPSANGVDYTYARGTVDGFSVEAANGDANIDGSTNEFDTTSVDVNLPFYLDQQGMSQFVLPLRALRFHGTLSDVVNCIGHYNAEGLSPDNDCQPTETAPPFVTGGSFESHILLEDADQVIVPPLHQSLCVILSGDSATYGDGGSPALCKRTDGVIDYQGNWCSATDAPGDGACRDAVRFNGGFAASTVQGGSVQ
ncbi:MAG: hypothetical protein HOW73_12915, partial [Polyangiaceae bacterium]|nr:hypothetical protein [Polyangiaceae bacterium]